MVRCEIYDRVAVRLRVEGSDERPHTVRIDDPSERAAPYNTNMTLTHLTVEWIWIPKIARFIVEGICPAWFAAICRGGVSLEHM